MEVSDTPRTADHEGRRRQVLEAVCQIATRGGLPAATFREIASEAGTSVRVVQYYFGTKAELLRAANGFVLDRTARRLVAAIEALGANPVPSDVVRAAMKSFLPRDQEARESIVLFYAFYATELTAPRTGSSDTDRGVGLQRLIAHQIIKAQDGGLVPKEVDAAREATMLFLLVPTIASGVVANAMTFDQAEALIDYAVTRAFRSSPSPRRPRTAAR